MQRRPWRTLPAFLRLWHRPRTVRMRLAMLSAAVILLSGGVLLAIAFFFGSRHTGVALTMRTSVNGHVVKTFPAAPTGPLALFQSISASRGGGAVISGHSSGAGGGPTVSDVLYAAQVGSSNAVHALLIAAILGLAIVTTLGLGLGWAFAGRVLRPLRTIRETTQRISAKNLHERLALAAPPGDELKELGDTIDGLLERLEAAFEAQRRFVQNASHELRTPITMMRTSLDVATGKPGGVPPEVDVLADKVGEGLDQAERLLEGFLALARAQSSTVAERAEVSLAAAATTALEAREEEIASLGLTVVRELDDVSAIGNESLLPQVVTNLIDNAIRHNEPGGWIRVATTSEGDIARLVVENGGARLEQERVDELGRPFHRLVDRTASDRGAGLGLSIVTAIVEAEGGSVSLRALEDGGIRVVVELSAVRSPGPTEPT